VKECGEIVQLLKSVPLKRKRTDEDDKELKRFTVGYSVSYVRDACLEMDQRSAIWPTVGRHNLN